MKAKKTSINFTKSEVEILKKHYKQELLKAEEKVMEIKQTIKNLNNLGNDFSYNLNTGQKKYITRQIPGSVRNENIKKSYIAKPVRSGNVKPIKWTNLIIETLKSKKILLPSHAFMDIVVSRYKINDEEKKRARSNITGCLSDLTRKYNRLVRYGKQGDKKGLYGLAEWFDSKGRIHSVFKPKLNK